MSTPQPLPLNVEGTETGRLPATAPTTVKPKQRRGFAAMDPERQREIASKGGRVAHAIGHAHEFTSQEAREAGRKRHAKNRQGSDL